MFQLKPAGKLKIGLSVNTPFGSTVQYEDNWIGRFALTRLELKAIFIQPTFAYRIADQLGIGGGFVISSGNVNLQKDIPVQDTNGVYGHAELAGKAIGFGYNIGIHFTPSKQLSIGLTYRSKVAMNLRNGEATFTVPSSLEDKFPATSFTGRLPLPSVTTLGFSYHPCSAFTVVLDINRVGWKVYDTLAFDYATNTSSLADTKSPRMYKNILAFRLGMEVKPTKSLSLRLGGGYGLTPVQSGYVSPETPDGIRIYGTFGLGYELSQKIRIDASVYYTKIKRSDTNLETNMSGTYTTIALAPGLSISYKW
jgi:long-chain fatty acid transport protein